MEANATAPVAAPGVFENGEDPAANQGEPILRVDSIDAAYGKVQILHGVSMVVHPGEAVSIIGPNGAGKSTVLKSVCGLLKPSSGSITFGGTNVIGMRPEQIIRHVIVEAAGAFACWIAGWGAAKRAPMPKTR